MSLPPLARTNHINHVKRCLFGLPFEHVQLDSSRSALVFYCIATLDLLSPTPNDNRNRKNPEISESESEQWREWIWEQQSPHGGFKSGPFMADLGSGHIIMTYTSLLTLAILRDRFTSLNRPAVLRFLQSSQTPQGGFGTTPSPTSESDLRTIYCAFAIAHMLGPEAWAVIDVEKAVAVIRSAYAPQTGGFGVPGGGEPHGGMTYVAVAALHLSNHLHILTPKERTQTIRFLLQTHSSESSEEDEEGGEGGEGGGGFSGRLNKPPDTCYCFWNLASLCILLSPSPVSSIVDTEAIQRFLARCQFRYGGLSKAPGENADPYHTFLGLAGAALCATPPGTGGGGGWSLKEFDPVLNTSMETVRWIGEYLTKD